MAQNNGFLDNSLPNNVTIPEKRCLSLKNVVTFEGY